MKPILKSLLLAACVAFGASSCHNGNMPEADQDKKLDHLIFEEICYEGTYDQNGYRYDNDNYIKITNPTDKSVYLDGLGLAISALSASDNANLAEGTDVTPTHFTAGTLMRFPGKVGEKNHELKPNESIYVAAIAHNHRVADDSDFGTYNEYSYDLSTVDFQWMTVDEINYMSDFLPNESVPYLTRVYPYGDRSVPYALASNGYAIALIAIPEGITDEQILDESDDNPYAWYTSTSALDTGGGHGHGGKTLHYLKFPYEMVIDAVQICSQNSFKVNRVSGADAGYASTTDYPRTKDNYFLGSLYRKHDGLKFVDTNNSTEDFEVRPASIWLKFYKDPTAGSNTTAEN